MAEIEKHLEQAEKYLQKGKSEAALREYLQVLQVSPEHEMANQAAASLFQALGRGGEAVRLWGNLFERYAAQGQTAAAMAAYRKLAEVAPPPPERILMLARLLESESPKEAVERYRDATSAWMLAGRNREALEAWEESCGWRGRWRTCGNWASWPSRRERALRRHRFSSGGSPGFPGHGAGRPGRGTVPAGLLAGSQQCRYRSDLCTISVAARRFGRCSARGRVAAAILGGERGHPG